METPRFMRISFSESELRLIRFALTSLVTEPDDFIHTRKKLLEAQIKAGWEPTVMQTTNKYYPNYQKPQQNEKT